MFRRAWLLVFALPVFLALAVACGDPRNEDEDDLTATIPAEVTETEEPEATETVEAEATEEPVETETAEPEPAGPTTLDITAANIEFSTDLLEAPAGEITVVFTNEEALPHNWSLYEDDEFQEDIVLGELLTSEGDSEEIDLGEVEAGTYYFRCDVHPQAMIGELVVE